MSGAGGTVLIVDDMKLARLKLKQICEGLGFTKVVEAANGAEGWKLLETGALTPHLVLSDYNMPDMNGIQFLEKIRSNKPTSQLPVILVTSESERSLILSAVTLQVTDFIVKPYTDEEVVRKVKSAISKVKAS